MKVDSGRVVAVGRVDRPDSPQEEEVAGRIEEFDEHLHAVILTQITPNVCRERVGQIAPADLLCDSGEVDLLVHR